ncbi:MAG TPA: hypothetical protein VF506_13545 [Streptosporangiaceae bacterium]
MLSARLRDAGEEGQGLRRELFKAITEAAAPLAEEVQSVQHLDDYLPNHYAATLAADMTVGTQKRFGKNPSVAIRARGRAHRRKLRQLDDGVLHHTLWGNRAHWFRQAVRPGFFSEAAQKQAPEIRHKVLDAMAETGRKITGK